MAAISSVVLNVALIVVGLNHAPKVEPDEFQRWFLGAYDGRFDLPETVVDRIQGYRFVFVLGLLHENSPGYIEQNVKELIALGVPSGSIHRIAPNSDASISENLGVIRAAFRSIADEGPEPIVVIGHSRGACDALAFALAEPEFVAERIVALFLIQGPFGGSGAADYLVGDGIPMDRKMPPPARAVANLFRNAEAKRLERGKHAGILDLTSEASEGFWKRTLRSRKAAIPIVGPRTFYIESVVAPSKQPPFRRPVARYLQTYYGPNDGMVAAGGQSLPGIGTRLGMLDVGHNDLTHRFPAARPRRKLRTALVQAIAMAVGRDAEARDEGGRKDEATVRASGRGNGGSGRAARP